MNQKTKRRLPPAEAKAKILETAHAFFLEGGVAAVKIQTIAKSMGMTDAAIHYHFKNREKLLEALLAYGGRQLKARTAEADSRDFQSLTTDLSELYGEQQFARLAMWLSLEGWRSDKEGMFDALVSQWQEAHDVPLLQAQHQIAFLNMVLAAEPLLAGSFLRSVGLKDNATTRADFHAWCLNTLEQTMNP